MRISLGSYCNRKPHPPLRLALVHCACAALGTSNTTATNRHKIQKLVRFFIVFSSDLKFVVIGSGYSLVPVPETTVFGSLQTRYIFVAPATRVKSMWTTFEV